MKIILTSLFLLTYCAAHSQTDSAVYFNPEITAMYPGGTQAWLHYLQKNLKYPDLAVSNEIQGTVVIQFMVDSLGLSHDITVLSGPKELRDESIRLIKNVGIWSPGIAHGKKVNSWKTQPFYFKLVTH